MTTVSIRMREAKEQGNISRAASSHLLADEEQDLTLVIKLVEATRERKLAEAIMPVIGCIDGITEDLHLLVTRDNEFGGIR